MAKRKKGIGTIEINKRFRNFDEASRYAKRLRHEIDYICKKRSYQATVMTCVSNVKKEASYARYEDNGKRGRPKKELVVNKLIVDNWYKGEYHTCWHIHVLIVSKPGYALRNRIKDYIDKRWVNIPEIYEKKEFDISMLDKMKVYKKTANIKIADYFIDQSAEVRCINVNYSGEKDFEYTLRDYYKEYLRLKSAKRRLSKKHLSNQISQKKYEEKIIMLDKKFKEIEDYFYLITEEQEKKEREEYMKKVQMDKIAENYNKMQKRNRRALYEDKGI